MSSALSSLIVLQDLDTAAEVARRRLAELPAALAALHAEVAQATTVVTAAKATLTENQHARRDLEKEVAQVDTRLKRFDDHKAAVKTNHEYTALLHETATAKTEKDQVEEKILILLEGADVCAAAIKSAEATLADVTRQAKAAEAALARERTTLEGEVSRLATERTTAAAAVDRAALAKYEQLLKQRRMLAVGRMTGETCTACHVRLRPAVAQAVRRNTEIVQCDSCQRILYFIPPEPAGEPSPPPIP